MPGTLGFYVVAWGPDDPVRYTALYSLYLRSARCLGYTEPGTLGFYVGAWEAAHPVR